MRCHLENGGTLGMVPLRINPIYTLLYSGHLLDISIYALLAGFLRGVKQLGALHPKRTTVFPMTLRLSHFPEITGNLQSRFLKLMIKVKGFIFLGASDVIVFHVSKVVLLLGVGFSLLKR